MKQITLTALLFTEFLAAYPFNVQVMEGETLLISNLDENFQLEFSPFRKDGEEIELESFLLEFAKGDSSITDDWALHVEREEHIEETIQNEKKLREWEREIVGVSSVEDYGPDN